MIPLVNGIWLDYLFVKNPPSLIQWFADISLSAQRAIISVLHFVLNLMTGICRSFINVYIIAKYKGYL